MTRAGGCDAVLAFATELLTHVAGHRFEARSAPDLLDDRLRLRWRAVAPDGSEFATGTDVLHVRPDGLVSSVTTFLDRAPDGFVATRIYERARLTPGVTVPGPAIVEQADTTTVIPPGYAALAEDSGNLRIRRTP